MSADIAVAQRSETRWGQMRKEPADAGSFIKFRFQFSIDTFGVLIVSIGS
jgi:hypothetical protein